MTLPTFVLIAVALILAWRACSHGNFYIEFNGDKYRVWRRDFFGYDSLMGFSVETEEQARNLIKKLQENPPRIIEP